MISQVLSVIAWCVNWSIDLVTPISSKSRVAYHHDINNLLLHCPLFSAVGGTRLLETGAIEDPQWLVALSRQCCM